MRTGCRYWILVSVISFCLAGVFAGEQEEQPVPAIDTVPVVVEDQAASVQDGQPVASQDTQPTQSEDDLLLSGIPISYGDERFRQRILERTEGKRSPVGLVLSGGSARAMAHIGVLKYLEEQGIVPDYIISNSMGSIVGLLYAAGMSPTQIERCIKGIEIPKMIDFTMPMEGGLLKADSLSAYAVSLLGGKEPQKLKLENLDIPIIVVQEDLVTKRQILVSEGDFATIFRASFAIPVYFPSVEYKGHLLIDGGISNLAPINLAYEYSDDVIVSTTFNTVNDLNLKDPLTAINALVDIQKRRTGVQEITAHPEMVWIRCAVEKVSFMDFAGLEGIVQKGYEAAKSQSEALSKLPQTLGVVSMEPRRSELEKTINGGIEHFSVYNHVRQTNLNNTLSFEFNSYLPDEAAFLKDSGELGLAYQMKWGNFQFFLLGGSSLTTYRDAAFSASPVFLSKLSYYAWHHTKFSITFDVNFDQGNVDPSLYLRTDFVSKYLFLQNRLVFKLVGGAEYLKSSVVKKTFTGRTFMGNTGFDVSYVSGKSNPAWDLTGSRGALLFQFYGNQHVRPFLGLKGDIKVAMTSSGLFLNLKTNWRFALDRKGNVPVFAQDGYRTDNLAVRSEGHNQAVANNPSNMLFGFDLTIGWKPVGFKPSIMELIIFKDTTIAAYFDFLWINDPYFSTGLEFTLNPSFLGMKDFPLTVFCGYENAARGIVWGFWLTNMLD